MGELLEELGDARRGNWGRDADELHSPARRHPGVSSRNWKGLKSRKNVSLALWGRSGTLPVALEVGEALEARRLAGGLVLLGVKSR